MLKSKRLLFCIALFILVFSSFGGGEATAAPQKVILGKISVQHVEFQPNLYSHTYTLNNSKLFLQTGTNQGFYARVPFPNGKVSKRLKAFFTDQHASSNGCITPYSFDVVTQVANQLSPTVCTTGSPATVQTIIASTGGLIPNARKGIFAFVLLGNVDIDFHGLLAFFVN